MTLHAVYRCFYCHHDLRGILDHGTERRLWCSRCACRRRFIRQKARLKAEVWPPPARKDGGACAI